MIFQKVDEGGGGHLGVISVELAFEPRRGGDYWVRERERVRREEAQAQPGCSPSPAPTPRKSGRREVGTGVREAALGSELPSSTEMRTQLSGSLTNACTTITKESVKTVTWKHFSASLHR